jgi:hypothetical protein
MLKTITAISLIASLAGCAHHPVDCAIGVPWSDCLEGTAGYNNGGGTETRETALKLELAKRQVAPNDLYTDLTKLDDLRKKGILTQTEYDEQKTKLLSKH